MPYKDPEKRKAMQRVAQKRYAEKHPDKVKLRDYLKHQKAREKRLAQRRERNRALGHQERPKGPRSKPEITVPLSRRWAIHTGPDGITRLYFTSKKGFELSEMQEILRTFKQVRSEFLKLHANLEHLTA